MRTAALLVLAAAATISPSSTFPKGPISPTASHEIVKLETVASTLSQRRVTVNCWSRADWTTLLRTTSRNGKSIYADAAAFANIGRAQIQLGPPTCATLRKILRRENPRELDAATAVGVLAHEARHTAGVESESKAECGAMQTIPRTARLLGIADPEATRLAHVYRGMIYPLDLPQYRSSSCRAGLPAVVVANEFGPDDAVAQLRARVRAARSAVPSWTRLPVPLAPLGRCSAVRSRVHEVARVEEMAADASRKTILDVAAVEFDSAAELAKARGKLVASVRCFAAAENGTVGPLPVRGAIGARVVVRGVVQDQLFVVDEGRRTLLAIGLTFHDGRVDSALEGRIFRAASN